MVGRFEEKHQHSVSVSVTTLVLEPEDDAIFLRNVITIVETVWSRHYPNGGSESTESGSMTS